MIHLDGGVAIFNDIKAYWIDEKIIKDKIKCLFNII